MSSAIPTAIPYVAWPAVDVEKLINVLPLPLSMYALNGTYPPTNPYATALVSDVTVVDVVSVLAVTKWDAKLPLIEDTISLMVALALAPANVTVWPLSSIVWPTGISGSSTEPSNTEGIAFCIFKNAALPVSVVPNEPSFCI